MCVHVFAIAGLEKFLPALAVVFSLQGCVCSAFVFVFVFVVTCAPFVLFSPTNKHQLDLISFLPPPTQASIFVFFRACVVELAVFVAALRFLLVVVREVQVATQSERNLLLYAALLLV